MESLFCALGVFCLVYYCVIAGTAFSSIWLLLAVFFAAAALVCRYYDRFRDRIPLRLEVGVITLVAAAFVIFLVVELAMGVHFFSLERQSFDYVIVLGAKVNGNEPSKTLELRLKKTLEYARVHPNTVFVLSGGQGEDEAFSEAQVMYDYLLERGIPDYQMMKEEQSTSTYENMVYSKLLIDRREELRLTQIKNDLGKAGIRAVPEELVTIHVGIITSNFHVMRAKGIANRIGLTGSSGIAAESDPVLFLHFCVRECFAVLKDKFVGNM